MRISRYLNSLRIRIVFAIASLALISALIYSVFAWFIFEISDDRLFNWQALTINKHAVEAQKLPKTGFNSFSLIGNEDDLLKRLTEHFPMILTPDSSYKLADIFEISSVSNYSQGHKILDIEYKEDLIELQIVVSPWQQEWMYVIYDVTGFKTAAGSTNLYSDNFVLLVLIPLAVMIAMLATFLSIGLTHTILKPLTNLASQVTSVTPTKFSEVFTEDFYPDEVGELANTFNQFIARIEKHVENEKRFSREVSHELRTPTTSLTIALDLFETTTLNSQQKQLLARMQRANKDMTQLINTFIWLAKNSPENSPKEKVNLCHYINLVLEKLTYLNEDKQVTITNKVAKQHTIIVNPTLLDIVLNNLLRNALQYTQHGSIQITSSKNSLTIIDTGLGIPAEEIENIEKAFYSLQPDGIGLGMSIVQRITNKLGWQLLINSQVQEGTEVTVIFSDSKHL